MEAILKQTRDWCMVQGQSRRRGLELDFGREIWLSQHPRPMLPFKLVYSEKYYLPIGEHVFRADKFRLIRERLLEQKVADESDFIAPEPASESDVMLVHSPLYVNKLMEGSLSAREELEMEIPYSPQVVDAFMLHTGGSILAAERALGK